MTPEEFRQRSLIRSPVGGVRALSTEESRLALYETGLAGEAGEVCDEIKKFLWHDKPLDRAKIERECGDVLWYLDRILMWIGCTIESAMQANVDKLAERYPDGWDAAERKYDHEPKDDRLGLVHHLLSPLALSVKAAVTRVAREQHGITNIAALRDPAKIQTVHTIIDSIGDPT